MRRGDTGIWGQLHVSNKHYISFELFDKLDENYNNKFKPRQTVQICQLLSVIGIGEKNVSGFL